MKSGYDFNIVCASHNDEILNKNLAASVFFEQGRPNEVKVIKGLKNVPFAYNLAGKFFNTLEDHVYVYAHHDVLMPEDFEQNLKHAIAQVNTIDNNWGVLGVAGVKMENGARKFYGYLKDRGNRIGTPANLPQEVQTLDELLLITKGDLTFDEQFDLHFYGADICMQAIQQGRKNYVIAAYVHHNSNLEMGYRSESFRECEVKFKNKWKDFLPLATTCTIIR